MIPHRPVDLVQDATDDCSLVAGLCAVAGLYERRDHDVGLSPELHVFGDFDTDMALDYRFHFVSFRRTRSDTRSLTERKECI